MNRLSLLTVASALLVFTTGVSADPSAKQAGNSPIYILDVTYNGKVAGKMIVDTANAPLPTYVLVARGLTPNTEYTFGYITPEDVFTIGSKETPKAGALVIKGSFPLDDVEELESAEFWVMETPPGGSYSAISGFYLMNWGGFVAKIACYYSTDGGVTWKESSHTSDITIGKYKTVNLDDYGVPAGALIRIHVIVVAGKDRTGSEIFESVYYPSGPMVDHGYANYTIYGTTWNPDLEYDGIEYVGY